MAGSVSPRRVFGTREGGRRPWQWWGSLWSRVAVQWCLRAPVQRRQCLSHVRSAPCGDWLPPPCPFSSPALQVLLGGLPQGLLLGQVVSVMGLSAISPWAACGGPGLVGHGGHRYGVLGAHPGAPGVNYGSCVLACRPCTRIAAAMMGSLGTPGPFGMSGLQLLTFSPLSPSLQECRR